MTEYKEKQIIKHALQHYIKRDNATEKQIAEEKRLLEKYINDVEQLKQMYGIK